MNGTQSVLSVSQVNEYLKMLMDSDRILSNVFVRGEISNFTVPRSGHLYFTLKDEDGQLKAVMFRFQTGKLMFRPEDGMKVIVHGRLSVYGPSGQYQLYADEIQPDGVGALAMRFEQLKRRLEGEGLFAQERKRPLPKMPMRIGIITSPTGAAIHDMLQILGRRFPCAELMLFPSAVQGAEAPAQLTLGIEFFGTSRAVDVIIIGRGGGSAEDLWAFNDETLARAVADCPIPVISAVGHESDFTICDFVADRRAPTPSAAAELAVPDKEELMQQFARNSMRMHASVRRRIAQERDALKLRASSPRLREPQQLLNDFRMSVSERELRLDAAMQLQQKDRQHRLSVLCGRLEALSPLSVLSRGYAAVSKDGRTVTSRTALKKGEQVKIQFADGVTTATVDE